MKGYSAENYHVQFRGRKGTERIIAAFNRKGYKNGVNAVIAVDFEISDILPGMATSFSAFGTAVVVESAKDAD